MQSQSQSKFMWRGLLVACVALGALAVVLTHTNINSNMDMSKMPDLNPTAEMDGGIVPKWSEPNSNEKGVTAKNTPQGDSKSARSQMCAEIVRRALAQASGTKSTNMKTFWSEHKDLLTEKGGLFGYADGKGRARLEPLGAGSFGRVEADDLDLTHSNVGTLIGANSVVVSLSDKTVITADADSCQITGFFMGNKQKKTYHPHALTHIVPKFKIEARGDGVIPCQGAFFVIFSKLGTQCESECLTPEMWNAMASLYTSRSPDTQCSTDITNNGWNWQRYHLPICCAKSGCGAPNCLSTYEGTKIALLGKGCTIGSNVCSFSDNFPVAERTSQALAAINPVLNIIGTALPGPVGSALKVIGKIFGFGLSLSQADQTKRYNDMLKNLDKSFTQMTQCIDQKILNFFTEVTIRSNLATIKENLSPNLLIIGTPQERIANLHRPNSQKCQLIRSKLATATLFDQLNAQMVLPYALETMVLCTAAYASAAVDYKLAGANFGYDKFRYESTAAMLLERTATAIAYLEKHFGVGTRCGYFPNQRTELCNHIIPMRQQILSPMAQMALAYHKYCINFPNTDIGGGHKSSVHATSASDCGIQCAKGSNCFCYTYDTASGTCYLKADKICGNFHNRNGYDSGVCNGKRIIHVYLLADEMKPKCDFSVCEKDEKCVGMTKECELIRNEKDARRMKPAKIMFNGASVMKMSKQRVKHEHLDAKPDAIASPSWGSCVATCASMNEKCVGADVKTNEDGTAQCFLYKRDEREKGHIALGADAEFDHYKVLTGVHPDMMDVSSDFYKCVSNNFRQY